MKNTTFNLAQKKPVRSTGFTHSSWVGLFAPAETPVAITGKINADLRAILPSPNCASAISRRTAPCPPGRSRRRRSGWPTKSR
ncbi:MAG: hypothetical protein FJY55_07035 [Betaproteobacteria bacterium]|nr:hypothetical protein [Betaproteobacteria bacterium]